MEHHAKPRILNNDTVSIIVSLIMMVGACLLLGGLDLHHWWARHRSREERQGGCQHRQVRILGKRDRNLACPTPPLHICPWLCFLSMLLSPKNCCNPLSDLALVQLMRLSGKVLHNQLQYCNKQHYHSHCSHPKCHPPFYFCSGGWYSTLELWYLA